MRRFVSQSSLITHEDNERVVGVVKRGVVCELEKQRCFSAVEIELEVLLGFENCENDWMR